MAVQLNKLNLSFDRQPGLTDLTLNVFNGDKVALTGPGGSILEYVPIGATQKTDQRTSRMVELFISEGITADSFILVDKQAIPALS